jgi:NADPH:quinone reductase-like Zn-dependent oxidoreductase
LASTAVSNLSNAMRQIVITRYGGPEVLKLRETAAPAPREGEVRIAVRAAGINFVDILARMGVYPDAPTPPFVPGYEVAGEIEAVGGHVAGRREGDRVMAFTPFGGYADTVVVPAAHTFLVPPQLTNPEAAAVPVNYLTAYIALWRLANVEPGETVLIHGAGGGTGIAALQLARLRRAVVIGTASSSKHEALRGYGADHLLDHRRDDITREVRRLTDNRGVDVVLDPLGSASFRQSYDLLAPLGRLIVYGASEVVTGERRSLLQITRAFLQMPKFRPLALIEQNRGVFGLHAGRLWTEVARVRAAMAILIQELEVQRLHPVIARTFELERADEAHRFIHARANIGKVVLTS